MAKRAKAQRSAAAKASWAKRRAASLAREVGEKITEVAADAANSAWQVVQPAPPRVTFSATHEGNEFYLGVSNNGSLHRVRAEPDALKVLALDILRIVN